MLLSRCWTKLARTFECLDGRTSFWDSVAFYNYVQEFMSAPREDPTPIALPDGRRIPCSLMHRGDAAAIVSYINHPSSGGYSYDAWCPVIAALLHAARERTSA